MTDDNCQTTAPGGREISREEARDKRRRFLEQAAKDEQSRRERGAEIESEDSTLANMILPGDE